MPTMTLSEFGTTFATRPWGAELRAKATDLAGRERHLELDCTGVLAVSYSFADEFAGRLSQGEDASPAVSITIKNASPDVLPVFERAILRRRSDEATLSLNA